MDEISLFTTLRPTQPADPGPPCQRARDRLTQAVNTAEPGRPLRLRPRRLALAGACAAAIAACAAVVLPAVPPGSYSGPFITAAWTVQRNPDGTVTITIKEAGNPAGMQRALSADGVRARVVSPPVKTVRNNDGSLIRYLACNYPDSGTWFVPQQISQEVVTWNPGPKPVPGRKLQAHPLNRARRTDNIAIIRPSAMPAGSVLFISDSATGIVTYISRPAVLKSDYLPPCIPATAP